MKSNADNEARRSGWSHAGVLVVALVAILSLVFVVVSVSNAETLAPQPATTSSGWTVYIEETFESVLGSEWTISDLDGGTNGEYYWARTNNAASGGSFSAWATGGGAQGSSLEPGVDDYPNSAASLMVHDPVDLSGQNSARLKFDVWHKSEPTLDFLEVAASTDGATYTTLKVYSGDSGGWISEELDMSAYAGNSSVYVRFYFSSDAAAPDEGVYLDNIRLEALSTQHIYFPLVLLIEPEFFYFDDFSNPHSGWPIVDNTSNPQDCFKWYYNGSTETYRNDICDDRTDVKVSPGVELPEGDYSIEADGRFRRSSGMWWTSYGILFDAKDDPNPSKPDLGDYYMVWVLWEGKDKHKFKILRDVPGAQEDVTPWKILDGSYYDYGNNGTNFNSWRIERTDDTIRVLVNGQQVANVSGEPRPISNYQVLFGVYSSTYETSVTEAGYDNYLVDWLNADVSADGPYWSSAGNEAEIVVSGQFDLEDALPKLGAESGASD